jgi:uncharacterized tellurite resistance protein B-like protein
MQAQQFEELLLQTAFCCMISDGNIDEKEIATIKSLPEKYNIFQALNIDEALKKMTDEFREKDKNYILDYYKAIENYELDEQQQLTLIRVAIDLIKADERIEYSEVKFFKTIRYRLPVADDTVIEKLTETIDDIELFLGDDINANTSVDAATANYLQIADFTKLNIEEVK